MSRNPKKSRGLGRGLSALMSDIELDGTGTYEAPRPDMMVPVENVRPNPDQPRRHFAEDALTDLTASILERGIIQPLIVRRMPDGSDGFEIVAGERRWRAAQAAHLHEVPVIVREYSDTEVLEVAIIENIQRADLNPVDEAAGYRQLMDRFGHTQDQLASALGKSRSHIANLMRLLQLPEAVQSHLVSGDLTAGHARALIGHPEAVRLAGEIIRRNLSVRDVEKLVKKPVDGAPKLRRRPVQKDADTVQIEQELSGTLGMKVGIEHKSGEEGGTLSIRYATLDQLDDLLRTLSGG